MKAVHFGAGSIGRGFIGDLLHESGYEVVFLDNGEEIVEQINASGSYDLLLINEGNRTKTIGNVRAVSSVAHAKEAAEELATADIITTSVWSDNFRHIASLLAAGLAQRLDSGGPAVNVIACENAMLNGDLLRAEVLAVWDRTDGELDSVASFPNTAVDRLVIAETVEGASVIKVGAVYELVVERDRLVDPDSTPIEGAVYADDVVSYIERKLYVINCGHSWAGYVGHVHGYTVMQDVLDDELLREGMRAAMLESAALLELKYGFGAEAMASYIDFAIGRFRTPGVVDTVARVCRSPIRKLGADERFVGPARQALAAGLPVAQLVVGIAAIFRYHDPDDSQSVELHEHLQQHGLSATISRFTGLSEGDALHALIVNAYTGVTA